NRRTLVAEGPDATGLIRVPDRAVGRVLCASGIQGTVRAYRAERALLPDARARPQGLRDDARGVYGRARVLDREDTPLLARLTRTDPEQATRAGGIRDRGGKARVLQVRTPRRKLMCHGGLSHVLSDPGDKIQ